MKNRVNNIFLGCFLFLMLVACSDKNEISTIETKEGLQFQLDFQDYESDQEITRSVSVPMPNDTVSMGGVDAEMIWENDPLASPTRAIPLINGKYTIRAYQGGILKGEVVGMVNGGVFIQISNSGMRTLPHGTYRFFCFNDKVTTSGNNMIVAQPNVGGALIDQKDVIISEEPTQLITFNLKHVGARVRLKVVGLMHFPELSAYMGSWGSTSTPAITTIDGMGNITNTNGGVATINFTLPGSTEVHFGSATYNTMSREYYTVLPYTNATQLGMRFTGGAIYNQWMSADQLRALQKPCLFLGNHSYVLKVTLRPRYRYLFNDFNTGYLRDRGGRYVLGVVINDHLAIALKDATRSTSTGAFMSPMWWINSAYVNTQANTNMYWNNFWGAFNNNDGYQECRDPAYSAPGMGRESPNGKSTNTVYIAHTACLGYRPDGVVIPPNHTFLPSLGQWHAAMNTLGFMNTGPNINGFGQNASSYNNLANWAFTSAGGEALAFDQPYWSASEYNPSYACVVHHQGNYTHFGYRPKGDRCYARTFIQF